MYKKINERIKQAMRDKDKDLLLVLREMKTKIDEVMKEEMLTSGNGDIDYTPIFQKMAKARKQSIEAFSKAGNIVQAAKEKWELEIIEEYLPKMMDEDELEQAIYFLIYKNQYSSMKDMGKVMGDLKVKIPGQYDAGMASKITKMILNS